MVYGILTNDYDLAVKLIDNDIEQMDDHDDDVYLFMCNRKAADILKKYLDDAEFDGAVG